MAARTVDLKQHPAPPPTPAERERPLQRALRLLQERLGGPASSGPCGCEEGVDVQVWKDRTIVSLRQSCDAEPVLGSQTKVIFAGEAVDEVLGLAAHAIDRLTPDERFSEEEAMRMALAGMQVVNSQEVQRFEIHPLLLETADEGTFAPTWQVTVEREAPYGYRDFFISRVDGTLLAQRDRVSSKPAFVCPGSGWKKPWRLPPKPPIAAWAKALGSKAVSSRSWTAPQLNWPTRPPTSKATHNPVRRSRVVVSPC